MSVPSFKLNNGLELPSVGLGVWLGKPGPVDINDRHVEDAVAAALAEGYRHIDTAALYGECILLWLFGCHLLSPEISW